ncbi:hypothetical protein EG327_010623 [Venturia inaequalis]|uniref:Uncharacterized protein n=1 Tax=Venturia inaequalis TaxID=5025 RepID=A0A8H3UGD6_VENIN|nr:hypothetical protein EG327_010623 [Venturia inaequalis]
MTQPPPEMSAPHTTSPFLTLPAEIRVLIYEFVLPYSMGIHSRDDAQLHIWNNLTKENLSLLAVNKLIRNETCAELYAGTNKNVFNVTVTAFDFKIKVTHWHEGKLRIRDLSSMQIYASRETSLWNGLRSARRWSVAVQLPLTCPKYFNGPKLFFKWLDKTTALIDVKVDGSWKRYKYLSTRHVKLFPNWLAPTTARNLRLAAEGIRKGIGSGGVTGNWDLELREMVRLDSETSLSLDELELA